MEKIELFKYETPGIKISMVLYFDEKGQLIFEGYDIGKIVEDIWGDSDYEYCYTIKSSQVDKLFSVLGIVNKDRKSLLLELKKRFANNTAYTDFGNFLTENKIEFEPFIWT